MYFDHFFRLITMDKHGVFVLTAYGIVLFSLITIHLISRLRHRRLKRKLRALEYRNKHG